MMPVPGFKPGAGMATKPTRNQQKGQALLQTLAIPQLLEA